MKTIKYTKGKFLLLPIGERPKEMTFIDSDFGGATIREHEINQWIAKFNNNEGAVEIYKPSPKDSFKMNNLYLDMLQAFMIKYSIYAHEWAYIHIPSEKVEIKNGKGYLK